MIFDLEDKAVTTPETDRRRGRYTVLVATVLVLVLGGLIVAVGTWIARQMDHSDSRAEGEKVFAAIGLPPEWDRKPVGYRAPLPFVTDGKRYWNQSVVTDQPTLSMVDGTLHDALIAVGWKPTANCASPLPNQIVCHWSNSEYLLDSTVSLGASAGASCPQDRRSCVFMDFTLQPISSEKS